MTHEEFNKEYPVGKHFIYQVSRFLRGGTPVRSISKAKVIDGEVVIQIDNESKSWVPVKTLTPAG